MTNVTPPSDSNPKKQTLREVFNKFAADAADRFPQLNGKLLVLDMNEHKIHGLNHLDEKKTKLTKESAVDYLSNHPITREMEVNKHASPCTIYDERKGVHVIFMNDPVKESERDNVKPATEQNLLFILDHELGHCAIRNGFGRDQSPYSALLAETVADAYALIRHYQRFGTDSPYANKYVDPSARAENFILGGDAEHFTSFTLAEIIKRKDEIDFNSLSPQETADLARRFALEFMPPAPAVEDMFREMNDVRKAFAVNFNGGVKALVEKALDPKTDYFTFKLGYMWLHKYLDKGALPDGSPLKLPKEYVDDAKKRLKEREMKFAQESILFNVPKKPAAPRNNLPPAPPKLAA